MQGKLFIEWYNISSILA